MKKSFDIELPNNIELEIFSKNLTNRYPNFHKEIFVTNLTAKITAKKQILEVFWSKPDATTIIFVDDLKKKYSTFLSQK